jgi:2-C-methyl-D-erythritol 4-phosphate cytidylyltransferase/2-C-methyl-D-erythritol 2,4-cyclodiphosphate synthase
MRAAAEGAVPKQYRPIRGQPMLARAVRPFLDHPRVGPVVVVLPVEDAAAPPAWLTGLAPGRIVVVAGGATRQESVANGLRALPAGPVIVLVHDAARPFVDRGLVDRVIAVAEFGAVGVPGLPLSDTVKETDAAGLVIRTVARERFVAVQTPQSFPRDTLETAHQRARGEAPATDDAALCERLGTAVRVVAGSQGNLKVTTAQDFALAEALAGLDGGA